MPKYELPAEIDTLEDVAENLRPLYLPKDGGGYSFEDVTGLKTTLHKVKTEKAELGEKLRTIQSQLERVKGIDPDEYSKLLARKREIEEAQVESTGEIQRIKDELKASFEERERRAREEAESIWAAYSGDFLKSTIDGHLARAGVPEHLWSKVRKLIQGDVTVDREGTRPVVRILDEHGKPRLNAEADPMGVPDLIAELRKEFPMMFPSTGPTGSGSSSASQGASDEVPQDRTPSKWSFKQRKAFIDRNGHDAYQKLVEAEARKKTAA